MAKRLLTSMTHAIRGIRFVWQHERNFRIQVVIAVLVVALCFTLKISRAEWIYITIAIAAVLVAEMLNTIVEELLDIVEPRFSVHVGRLKDVTAGVVLLLSCFAVVMGSLAIIHHVI